MSQGFKAFSFNTPGSMHVEWGGAKRLGELAASWFEERNVLLVTDKFLSESGLLEETKASMEANGFSISIYDDVVADPPEHVLMECVEFGKANNANLVIGLGGGSPMDIAKLVAVMLT